MRHLRVVLDPLARRLRASPLASRLWAQYRTWGLERRAQRILAGRSGRADCLPSGVVYEATMRCNLHCEFCYVGALLNLEGEWREELPVEMLERAFPAKNGLQISLTGGEIFVRKDIVESFELFRRKGYVCGYITTNGTAITDERAEALAGLAVKGFLKHISVSIDGPPEVHDIARGAPGTFEKTARGLRRLQEAARRQGAPLRVSINTTVAAQSIDALDRMVDIAADLGVDAIGLNHLMFSTPEEVDETLRMLGVTDRATVATYVTADPGVKPEQVRTKIAALREKCAERGMKFDVRPKVSPSVTDAYYTAGTSLRGRCFYPFNYARVGFSGKMYFCPLIRLEVGDLATETLEHAWNSDRYIALRQKLLDHGMFPVCRRCCKVELARSLG